ARVAGRAAEALGLSPTPIFTYLANSLKSGSRQVPYSLVTALDLGSVGAEAAARGIDRPVVLNDWTARELDVRVGDPVSLDFYVWEDPGRLATRSATFQLAAIVPIAGAAADRELAPVYPGISGSETLRDWNPPFPIELSRVRPV